MSEADAHTGTIDTRIPARLDRLPWSRFHWLIVIGLGTVWILDGRGDEETEQAAPERPMPARTRRYRLGPGRASSSPGMPLALPDREVGLEREVAMIESALKEHGSALAASSADGWALVIGDRDVSGPRFARQLPRTR